MRDIPVYVISLRDSEVRRPNMTERLGALAIPFQFVDAIDGRTQRLPDVFDGARVVREGFWGESALACAMSHRNVHRIIAEGDSQQALVFEAEAGIRDGTVTLCSSDLVERLARDVADAVEAVFDDVALLLREEAAELD